MTKAVLFSLFVFSCAPVVVQAQTSTQQPPARGAAPAAAAAKIPTPGEFPAYKPPHTGDGKPDFNGIWQSFVTADIDIQDHDAQAGPHPDIMGAYGAWPGGQGIVEGGEIPYKPEALAKKKANAEKRMVVNITSDDRRHDTGDPELKCYRPGVPRANYMPFPFQIIQSTDNIMMVYEFEHTLRTIFMKENDKEAPKDPPADSWMGWSHGRFEGDTLVIDTTGFVPYTWFDRAGDFHSNAMKVTERYTPRSADTLMYEATIEDAKTFSRPWKISMPLYRHVEKNAQIMEYKCSEFAEEVMYGKFRKQPAK